MANVNDVNEIIEEVNKPLKDKIKDKIKDKTDNSFFIKAATSSARAFKT